MKRIQVVEKDSINWRDTAYIAEVEDEDVEKFIETLDKNLEAHILK